jgi:hypothetical protein
MNILQLDWGFGGWTKSYRGNLILVAIGPLQPLTLREAKIVTFFINLLKTTHHPKICI